MKKIITALLLTALSLNAQNITNTLGSTGTFTIKSSSTNFFTLSQLTGNAVFLRNVELGNIFNSTSGTGVITRGGLSFIHNYKPAGSNGQNTFLGLTAGNYTMNGTGSQSSSNTGIGEGSLYFLTTGYMNSGTGAYSQYHTTSGFENTSTGAFSLESNTSGFSNSAFGSYALNNVTSGYENSAFGKSSLHNNTGSLNSGFGAWSLSLNTTGYDNSSFGAFSMRLNTTGNENSAFGESVLYNNTSGSGNCSFGDNSMRNNTTGSQNCSFGYQSLYSSNTFYNSVFGYQAGFTLTSGAGNTVVGHQSFYNATTGAFNIVLGYQSGWNISTGNNNVVIGTQATVPNGLGDNQIRLGNSSITYAGIQVAWTVTSDRRLKDNILSSNLGLSFINKLRPVSYTRINDESGKTEYGLIAQEVEDALKQENTENTGMLTVTDEGEYQLRYNDLIAPMIKAIQELKAENDELKKRIEKLEESKSQLTNNK